MISWAISSCLVWRDVLKSAAAAFIQNTSFWWVWFNEWPERDFPSKQLFCYFPPLRCLGNVAAPIEPVVILVTAHNFSRSKAHNLDWHQIQGNLKGIIQLDWRNCCLESVKLSLLVMKHHKCLRSHDGTWVSWTPLSTWNLCQAICVKDQQKRWMFTYSSRSFFQVSIESPKLSWMRPDVASRRPSLFKNIPCFLFSTRAFCRINLHRWINHANSQSSSV